MEKKIRVACQGAATLPLAELHHLQGNLKDLNKKQYEQLKKEILETGFAFPFHIWKDETEKHWIISGHQRRRVLSQLEKEGYEIPLLPVVYVEADSLKQAKMRVLQDVSQYGQIARQGLYEFLSESDLDIQTIEEHFQLPDIDMESFKYEYFEDPELNPSTDASGNFEVHREVDANPLAQTKETYLKNNIKQIVLYYETREFEHIIEKGNELLRKFGLNDFSDLFTQLVEERLLADENV